MKIGGCTDTTLEPQPFPGPVIRLQRKEQVSGATDLTFAGKHTARESGQDPTCAQEGLTIHTQICLHCIHTPLVILHQFPVQIRRDATECKTLCVCVCKICCQFTQVFGISLENFSSLVMCESVTQCQLKKGGGNAFIGAMDKEESEEGASAGKKKTVGGEMTFCHKVLWLSAALAGNCRSSKEKMHSEMHGKQKRILVSVSLIVMAEAKKRI